VVVRKVEESAVVAMQPWTILISIRDHRAHVVVQHLTRDTAKEQKRALVAVQQRLEALVVDELDVGRPAPSQRGNEHRQLVAHAPDGGEVGLHLAARISLEPNHRLRLVYWSQPCEMILQNAVAAWIVERLQLT
jgi:hypothetical protein